jgi:flagellar FliL protein
MSEEGETEETEVLAEEEPKGGMKKLILIVVPILLIGVGAGLYFTGALDGLLGKTPTEEVAEGAEGGEAKDGELAEGKTDSSEAIFVPIDDIMVNLSAPDGQKNFMRLRVVLEVTSESDADVVRNVMPRVIDQFTTFLREMRLEDLRGRAGTYRVRQELLYRVNLAVKPVVVRDVLFQDMLVQ